MKDDDQTGNRAQAVELMKPFAVAFGCGGDGVCRHGVGEGAFGGDRRHWDYSWNWIARLQVVACARFLASRAGGS